MYQLISLIICYNFSDEKDKNKLHEKRRKIARKLVNYIDKHVINYENSSYLDRCHSFRLHIS
jgi:hypothetical protein